MLRALTLVDVIAQLNTDSAPDVPFDATAVINQFAADAETLKLTGETLTATTVTNYPLDVIQDVGPVGYWRLDDPLAATTAYDSSPWATATYPKVPATVHGTVTFQATGAMNGSTGATFNGSTGYLEAASTSSLAAAGDLSLEMWLKPASLAAAGVLISKGATAEYQLTLNTNGSVTFAFGAFSATVVPAASISAGTWYHLVVTRTLVGKSVAAYLNGTSTYTGTYATSPTAGANPLRIGASSGGAAASFFNGALDEVVVYLRPLSAGQAANHHTWGTATDVGSGPYGVGKYGYRQYPTPGQVSGTVYGTAVYGTATYS